MTDTGNEERPLTRRELRARERAAAEAAQTAAQSESVPTDSPSVPSAPVGAPSASVSSPGSPPSAPSAESAPSAPSPAEPVETAPQEARAEEQLAPTQAMSIEDLAAERETQPLDPEDLPRSVAGLDSEPRNAWSSAPEQETELPEFEVSEQELAKPSVSSPQPDATLDRPTGRFFGRRKLDSEVGTDVPDDFDALLGVESSNEQKIEDPSADIDDLAAELSDDTAEDDALELIDPAPEVEAPARARGLRLDEGRRQHLDSVNDEDLDRIEIDEIEVTEARISAQSVSEKTPAQLEDTRGAAFEQEDEQPSGPTRGRSGRLPFVVNVVEDTSEHHISDLRRGSDRVQGNNVGSGSGNITANALVLPATGQEDEIQFEAEDGVLVTGSVDLPDGYASSGRARGKFDSADLDAAPDSSEVSNPETAPVRASKAVSSYASARVNIAPKRQSRSALPWALGIGGGLVFAGIVVVVVGYTAGWF